MAEDRINENATNELFEAYIDTKDPQIRNQIVERYLYIVDILVKKYLNKGIDYDDLYQIGSVALLRAVDRFDPTKGFQFSSFATPTIIGEIKRYFRDMGWAVKVPRQVKEIAMKIPAAKEALREKNGKTPTVGEVAEYLGQSEEKILEAMEGGKGYSTYSLNQEYDDDSEEGGGSVYEKYTGIEEKGYEDFENASMINAVLATLSDEEKMIFQERFINGRTQKDVSDKLNVSQMTVSRMETKIKKKFIEEANLSK